ncbi:putative Poly-beta-hydroxybutyrate polymerase [Legionella steigerwaltii]|uniref:PHA synthase n=1 Tax=Legionella steigerwaltii TaxID=460 RepID=A0A378L8Y1_9GAMM|nr:alpha/beta fold hydrolase [Legionella steigerwaltii]KTD81006.1 PHA synthase [Legionella steigerwaltii]STY23306.1 putative Poly-beta-hydroxybutyrate polymerase [Legionella steigerwaltii]
MYKSKKKHPKSVGNIQPHLSTESEKKCDYEGLSYDRLFHAAISQFSNWLSPGTLLLSFADWLIYLYFSPAKLANLNKEALKKLGHLLLYIQQQSQDECEPCIEVRQTDYRFQNELWSQFPFNVYSQSFLLTEEWWDDATTHLRGVSKHNENIVNFVTRQFLDVCAPSNVPGMNPEVITETLNEGGMNFIKGWNNFIDDVTRNLNNEPPAGSEHYKVGENIAITPGKVIYRNQLIELIQYEPTTSTVYPEPILIIPAWIMKYYILDLSPNNSMVKFLVDKGHTVFMISWKNPTSEDRDLDFSDYAIHGVMDALNTINQIIPNEKIHTVGYCIGGTLLTMVAAKMAAKEDDRLKSMTLFAAQTDFQDAGELQLFIDENQLTYIEDIMWEKGYLDGSQMAGAFSMLRSIDLIWSRLVYDYLLGKRQKVSDLMAWDYDTTRMPYKMHSEYLRSLFLNNDLVEGRFNILDETVNLADIRVPIFAVSTIKDHIAPWKSVYKIHYFTDSDITFVLTDAGHNTGIVNEPGDSSRSYQMLTHKLDDKHLAPDVWLERAPHFEGSWWPTWEKWLVDYSGPKKKPPELGNPAKNIRPLCDAPGTYVLKK